MRTPQAGIGSSPPRFRLAAVVTPLVSCVLCGCPAPQTQSSDRAELAERLAVAEARLAQRDADLGRLSRERDRLGERVARLEGLDPRARAAEFTVKGVELGGFTGGKNWDGKPGDDGLRLYLFPKDQNDDRIKRLGAVTIELYDLELAGQDRRIGLWQFSYEEAVRHWRSNPFLYGYYFQLPWQGIVPRHEDLEVRAVFVAMNGTRHVATERISVELPPQP